jgi:hypothetical protein
METNKLNIYQRLLRAQEAIKFLPKEGKHGQLYKYAKEETALELIKPHLVAQGLAIFSTRTSVTHEGPLFLVDMKYTIINTDNPDEKIELEFTGAGFDSHSPDKALYKAYTGCNKYFFFKTFLMPTGDDPEKEDAPMATSIKSAPKNGNAGVRKSPTVLSYIIEGKCSKTGQAISKIVNEDKEWLLSIGKDETKLSQLTQGDQANIKLAIRQLEENGAGK